MTNNQKSKYTMPVGGELYIAQDYSAVNTVMKTWNQTNGATVLTNLLAENWIELGAIQGFEESHSIEDIQEVRTMSCDDPTFSVSGNKIANISSTILFANKSPVVSKVLGANTETIVGTPGTSASQAGLGYKLGKAQMPFLAFLYISCPFYSTDDAVYGKVVSVHTKGFLGSSFVRRYLSDSDTLEGAELAINGVSGGEFYTTLLTSTTESDLNLTVTTV